MEAWQGYLGFEIYNAVIRRLEGSPNATNRWDMLLGQGRRLWGFAHDDCHRADDVGLAWNMVQCDTREPADLVEAMREGRHYCSTGVRIESIRVHGRSITIETDCAQRILAIRDFGGRVAVADGPSIDFTVPEDADYSYVRFECWGPGETMAWTQPFFIETD